MTVIVDTKQNAKMFEYHSVIMANYSSYIDTLLTSSMKESKSRILQFPDIQVNDWLDMIAYLEDPTEARGMTVDDAIKFAPLYDKYEFHGGMALCSQVLEEEVLTLELTHHLTIFELADKLGMACLYSKCVRWLQKRLDPAYDGVELCVEQLRMLAPYIVKEQSLMSKAFTSDKDEVLSSMWPKFFLSEKRNWQAEQRKKRKSKPAKKKTRWA